MESISDNANGEVKNGDSLPQLFNELLEFVLVEEVVFVDEVGGVTTWVLDVVVEVEVVEVEEVDEVVELDEEVVEVVLDEVVVGDAIGVLV